MQRLGMWASVYDCAIVLIGHLNKKEGTKGLYRSLGSIDVVAAARSVLQVERDQKDTDIRIVRQIKNSLAPSDGEIRFSITAEMGFQWLECKSTFVSSEQPKVPEFESKTEKAASNSGEIKCMALVRMIYGDSGWDKKMSYRLIGRAFPQQRLVSFKITDAMQIENGRVLTEM